MEWVIDGRCVVLLIVLHVFVCVSAATPIELLEIESFDDPWDYKIETHSDPLIKEPSKNHLASTNSRTGKNEHDDEMMDLQNLIGNSGPTLSCASCKLGVTLLRREVDRNATFEELRDQFAGLCVGLKIAVPHVCVGVFDMYGPVFLPALKICELETENICALLLGEQCGEHEIPSHSWNIELQGEPKENIWDSPPPQEGVSIFKVLHLSDTHYDPQYVEGSYANCREPLCCRSYSSKPEDNSEIELAGKWGSIGKCDAPKILLENMLEHIAIQHPDIDYVIWTGDIPPHDIWNQTREQNAENIRFTTQKLFDAFPNIPIFPILGNHETVPAGNYAPPWMKNENQSVAWLYELVSEEWKKWLPNDVNSSMAHGAFYSVLVRPNFRIIGLNTNYCYMISWWLVLNSTDPAHELQWLAYELQKAEDLGEKVHLIGHIPPGSTDCLEVWSRNYYNIINRYKDTVVAQFFGHTHTDEFEVFYGDEEFQKATAVAYIGPSVTTFEHLNPGYRIYYVDGDHEKTTREIIDHETWIMDLIKSNARPEEDPIWFKLYSAREAYDMPTLRPAEWARLIDLMVTDAKLFDLFYRHYYKASPVRPPCDDECRFRLICDQKSGKSNSRHKLCKKEEDILLHKRK